MGVGALDSHMKSNGHKKAETISNIQPSVAETFQKSKSASNDKNVEIVTTAVAAATNTVDNNSATDLHLVPVLQENLSATVPLNVVSNTRRQSNNEDPELFKVMFPDSKVASQFSLGRDNMSYLLQYGIAPTFHDQLVAQATSCCPFVVVFDESMNKIAQKQQQDIVIRFIDQESQTVSTRYFNSSFLEKQKAEDILRGLKDGLLGLGAKLENLLQVSMDGPNVNWKVLALLKQKVWNKPDGSTFFLELGSCGLHIVHGLISTANSKVGWNFFFSSLFSAACHQGSISSSESKIFISVSQEVKPFLRRFQSSKPLAVFLYKEYGAIIRNIAERVVKPDVLKPKKGPKLNLNQICLLDLNDSDILLSAKKVKIGPACLAPVYNDIVDKFKYHCHQESWISINATSVTETLSKALKGMGEQLGKLVSSRSQTLPARQEVFVRSTLKSLEATPAAVSIGDGTSSDTSPEHQPATGSPHELHSRTTLMAIESKLTTYLKEKWNEKRKKAGAELNVLDLEDLVTVKSMSRQHGKKSSLPTTASKSVRFDEKKPAKRQNASQTSTIGHFDRGRL
ncbi:Uncharacterized protein APZ42_030326 [Daphnia magna]|uniref:Uncharacterized protein n=1 Tax=Daphnia magna TaxID=35525 RepID=A0A162D379_9CRUS|nr:Uncharacterized protein APZ42_030326 [Daphnia magna]